MMLRFCLAILLSVGLGLVACRSSSLYENDELLWTKKLWPEFKLDFPYATFQYDDAEQVQAQQDFAEFDHHSLAGPYSKQELQQRVQENLRKTRTQPSSFDIAPLPESAPIDAATTEVVKCQACMALTSQLWSTLVNWTHAEHPTSLASLKSWHVLEASRELCEVEVPVEVLKTWVILRARMQQVGLDRDQSHLHRSKPESSSSSVFYLLTQRHRQHAIGKEIKTVQLACKQLLLKSSELSQALSNADQDNVADEGELSSTLAAAMEAHKEYVKYLKQTASGRGVEASTRKNAVAEEGAEELTGPRGQRQCYDRHPQCEYWANKGECDANPNYMVGTPASGWCRRACKACKPPHPASPPEGLGINIEDAAAEAKRLLEAFQARACTKASPCKWLADASSASRGADMAKNTALDPGSASVLNSAAVVSQPVVDSESRGLNTRNGNANKAAAGSSGGKPPLLPFATDDRQAALVADSAVSFTRQAENAVVPPGRHGKPTHVRHVGPGMAASGAERVLWNLLHGKCLYVAAGYWSYEVCYQASVMQYHAAQPESTPSWVISLGNFASANYDTGSNTTQAALWPAGVEVPYVEHVLRNGNECQLTGEAGVRPGSSESDGDDQEDNRHREKTIGSIVLRKSSLRFMCSPDASLHVIVDEPQQCFYVVEVYVPELCAREAGLEVHLPNSFRKADDTRRSTSIEKGDAESDREDDVVDEEQGYDLYTGADDGEELEWAGVSKGDEEEDENDPYVDPDDLDENGNVKDEL